MHTKKHVLGTMVADYMMPGMTSVFTSENVPALKCEKWRVAIIDTRRIGKTSFLKKYVQCGESIPTASEYVLNVEQTKKKRRNKQ
jgi:hypothetical protein